ncbi:MAG: hypothetical protein CSA68_00780 [Rhodobacterales bacterium]|nr:MAG: hypothetical protein CSA68_00780 [Rhodobacterales bacterium]
MTALAEYERLEAIGLWREAPDAQRREVIVSFGNDTVVIADANGTALTHWALAAIKRLNPSDSPACYVPDGEASESLEIEDELMISALEKVLDKIRRKRPRKGSLRWLLGLGLVAGVAALSVFWLPDALLRHTLSVLPQVKRLEIGDRLLQQIYRLSGPHCAEPHGVQALARLGQRVAGDSAPRLLVLRDGVAKSAHLPGGYTLLNSHLIEDFDEADVAAAYILTEQLRKTKRDPMEALLLSAGKVQTFTLLTTGDISDQALAQYAEQLLTTPPVHLDTQELLQGFEQAKLRSSPYAYAQDPSGETTFELIEADPYASQTPPIVISDGDWLNLQRICEN